MDYSKKTVVGTVPEASKEQLLLQVPPVPSPTVLSDHQASEGPLQPRRVNSHSSAYQLAVRR